MMVYQAYQQICISLSIGMLNLRFGSEYNSAQNYNSVMTIIALILLVAYTVGVPIFYYKKLKNHIVPDNQ
jgi:uncharacterized membrane protein SirB2